MCHFSNNNQTQQSKKWFVFSEFLYKIIREKALTRLKLMTFKCREARLKNTEGERDGKSQKTNG